MQCVAVCCSVLQHVAVCCSVLQHVAVAPVCCSVSPRYLPPLRGAAVCSYTGNTSKSLVLYQILQIVQFSKFLVASSWKKPTDEIVRGPTEYTAVCLFLGRMSVSVSMSVCVYICVYVYVSVYVCFCIYIYVNVCVCTYFRMDALQHTAICCNSLEHTATHCNTLQHTATHCNTLQHTATHCNTLQHTATHCNTPQHTATHRNTPQGGRHANTRGKRRFHFRRESQKNVLRSRCAGMLLPISCWQKRLLGLDSR